MAEGTPPAFFKGSIMTAYKYAAGQRVIFNARLRATEPSLAVVVRLLPIERQGLTYRIKSEADGLEQVANEYELTPLGKEALSS